MSGPPRGVTPTVDGRAVNGRTSSISLGRPVSRAESEPVAGSPPSSELEDERTRAKLGMRGTKAAMEILKALEL